MKVATSRFGDVDVRDDELFTAVRPLPGFANSTQYFFIERKNIAPFKWMQSAQESDLTFVVVEPNQFFHDYEPRIGAFDVEEVGLKSGKDVFILTIVVLPEDLTKMTANLKGPLVFNLKDRKFKQSFIETDQFTVRESIVDGIKKKEKVRLDEQKKSEAQGA